MKLLPRKKPWRHIRGAAVVVVSHVHQLVINRLLCATHLLVSLNFLGDLIPKFSLRNPAIQLTGEHSTSASCVQYETYLNERSRGEESRKRKHPVKGWNHITLPLTPLISAQKVPSHSLTAAHPSSLSHIPCAHSQADCMQGFIVRVVRCVSFLFFFN